MFDITNVEQLNHSLRNLAANSWLQAIPLIDECNSKNCTRNGTGHHRSQ